MNVRPRRWPHDGTIRTIPSRGNTLVVECEVTDPPSSRGRPVYLILDRDDVTQLIPELRSAAIEARR